MTYATWKFVDNVYFHPLRKYPGPIFAAASNIPIAYVSWNGSLSHWLRSLHESYKSDIIRISPNEVSVISLSSWKDLYSHRPGHSNFPKDLRAFAGVDNIVTASDSDHSRVRRLLSHAFSDKALREQESLIMVHVNNLMNGLKRQMESSTTANVNIVDWFMWTAFDVIGDLSFGESFNCLLDKKFHPWVEWIMYSLQIIVYQSVTMRFPLLERLLTVCIPTKAAKSRSAINTYSYDTVERRLNTETTRPDFLSYITKHNEDKEKGGMTRDEIHRNSVTFTTAGSETTAALLSATVWYLLQNSDCYEKINHEIRSTFKSVEEINLQRIIDLPYLQAVVDETFRIYPPGIAGQPRIAPKGGDAVSGYWIPEGTGVILNQYAANHASMNFDEPEVFAPARWIETDERFKHDKRGVVQPFSIGPRNCIGKK